MPTVKLKFKTSTATGMEGSIYFQITHNRSVRQVATMYKLTSLEWDMKNNIIKPPADSSRKEYLSSLQRLVKFDMERFNHVICTLNKTEIAYTADDIAMAFVSLSRQLSLSNYMEELISKMKRNGKARTSETYKSALNSFLKFMSGKDIMLDTMDSETIEAYGAYLQTKRLVPNTISFYMRILRAVYKRACEQGLIAEGRKPFAHVYTGIEKTSKRAVDLITIKRIKVLDLSLRPNADYARDMFMMCFYMRGMSFIDLAFLKKTDLCGNRLTYRRHKTGQKLFIKWAKEMQAILDKYPINETEYLMPIITSKAANHRNQYRRKLYMVNLGLKQVAAAIGLDMPLTTYVSRHAWASIAKAKGIPIGTISEALGHDCEQTTQIYLTSLDTSAVDNANDFIISSL